MPIKIFKLVQFNPFGTVENAESKKCICKRCHGFLNLDNSCPRCIKEEKKE